MKKIIANWKMNLELLEVQNWIETFNKFSQQEIQNNHWIGICPPALWINKLQDNFRNDANFYIGAQCISMNEVGAYTGEISAKMMKSAGASFALIGHSERRINWDDNNEYLVKQCNQAISEYILVVFCVGETVEIRHSGDHLMFVWNQIYDVLSEVSANNQYELAIAYEPVCSIGSGMVPTQENIEEMFGFIYKQLLINSNFGFQNVSLLYGGSVNLDNANTIANMRNCSGLLIGGASLNPTTFSDLIRSVK